MEAKAHQHPNIILNLTLNIVSISIRDCSGVSSDSEWLECETFTVELLSAELQRERTNVNMCGHWNPLPSARLARSWPRTKCFFLGEKISNALEFWECV